MKYQIVKRKLSFFHHLTTLASDSLAKEIFEIQKDMNLPGLVSECQKVLDEAGVNNVERYTKSQWKGLVNRLCKNLNEDDLLHQIKEYKKLDYNELKLEHCDLKNYMRTLNLFDARLRFKIRAHMTPTIQMNFKNDPTFKANLWSCTGCDRINKDSLAPVNVDTQAHVLVCVGYTDLRDGKDLDDDKDLVSYFSAIIRRRMSV